MWILKIIKRLLKIPKITTKMNIPKFGLPKLSLPKFSKYSFFKKWSKLKPRERDELRYIINQDKEIQKYKELSQEELRKIIIKQIQNSPISSSEFSFLKQYEDLFLNEKEPIIEKYDKGHSFDISDSSWISTVIYYPDTKRVRLLIENQNGVKKWYNFYNVPKTKYLTLIELGGKFMWDYFGKHYSLNPSHWVRKSEVGKVRVRKYYAKRK